MLEIRTNYRRREIVDACELSAAEREEFAYLDWPAIDRGEDSRSFVRYRGDLVDLGDLEPAPEALRAAGWHGWQSDTFWSGTAYRWGEDDSGPYVVVARVYAADE